MLTIFHSSTSKNFFQLLVRTRRTLPILRKLAIIHALQLRTPQVLQNRGKHRAQLPQWLRDIGKLRLEQIRRSLRGELEAKAKKVVSLCESGGVEDSACETVDIDSCEGVGLAGVAADGEELRVLGCGGEEVEVEVGDGVFVAYCAFVPA